jgi:lipopolysaccharide transport system permease protein
LDGPLAFPLGDAGHGAPIARGVPAAEPDNATESPESETVTDLTDDAPLTLIHARRGWQLVNFRELLAYRDLFRFLVRREIKVRYAQSAIGIGWAVLQPLCTMLILTVVFGRLASMASDGVPYALFSFTGLLPWLYFSNAVTDGVASLLGNAQMLSKVYFPRMFLPLSAVAARLIDFAVAGVVMSGLMAWYGFAPTWGLLALPWIMALLVATAAGVALWLAAFAVQFRDVKHALSFVVQLLMYAAPVVYPASLIPARYQYWYALNPLVGVIESFRAVLLGSRETPWAFLAIGTCTALLLVSSGALYFTRKQRSFADVA